jgi:hypothetical protein
MNSGFSRSENYAKIPFGIGNSPLVAASTWRSQPFPSRYGPRLATTMTPT